MTTTTKEPTMAKDREVEMAALSCLGVVFVAAFLVALGVAVNGIVVRALWGWFIVPLGAAPIGFAHAAGIAAFVYYFTTKRVPNKDRDDEGWDEVARVAGWSLTYAALVLATGWVLHLFMA